MNATLADSLLQCLSPLRLAGPVLDKELRVASRRRRLYVLRFAYVVALVLVVLQLWSSLLRSSGGGQGTLQVSRLAEMGKGIVAMVVWFQFITGQILAVVLLRDAIGSEIRQRTLDVLLLTPVGEFQLVIGKLASNLLQAVFMLAISLPMLAVARVFGGVPWDYVVAGLCITLSAGVFAGSLCLWSSISSRHPYQVVLTVGLWYLVIWGLLPMVLMTLSAAWYGDIQVVKFVASITNPLIALGALTQSMAVGYGWHVRGFWLGHCLILLAMAAVLLAWSVRRVRTIALCVIPLRVDEVPERASSSAKKPRRQDAIRPINGSPIVWRERCIPLLRMSHRSALVVAAVLTVALVLGVVLMSVSRKVGAFVVAVPLVQPLQLIFMTSLAAGAAGTITREREARTLPILLATPLEDGEIIKGKAIGVFRRNLPLLMPLLVLYPLMFLVGPLEPKTLLRVAGWAAMSCCNLASTTVLLLGVGLYFSTRLKRTTAAIVATFAVWFAPKFLFSGFPSPLLPLSAGMMGVMTNRNVSSVTWGILLTEVAPSVVQAGIGLLVMRLAARRVRREIF